MRIDELLKINFTAQFLNLEWNDALAHHEEHVGKEISLSNLERSTDQVVKPMYKSGKLILIFFSGKLCG